MGGRPWDVETHCPSHDSTYGRFGSPNSGTGASQSFTFKYSSVNGFTYRSTVYALINGSLSGSGGCYPYYVAASNALYMYNDAGTDMVGPLTPGSGGRLENSQCTINGARTSVTGTGSTLSVKLAVSFSPSFAGAQTLFGYAADSGNLNSGWQTLGTWTVPAGSFSELWDNAPDYGNKW